MPDDERHIVENCPRCQWVIWSGYPCPECRRREAQQRLDEPTIGGPHVDKPKRLRGGLER